MLYPDSGISMDEEIVLVDMIWSYNKKNIQQANHQFHIIISTALNKGSFKENRLQAMLSSDRKSYPSVWEKCLHSTLQNWQINFNSIKFTAISLNYHEITVMQN